MGGHARARSRRNDDGPLTRKDAKRVPRYVTGRFPVTGVERGLTAARLIRWDIDRATEMLEHFDGRSCDIVEKSVSEAGRHETDASSVRPRAGASRRFAGHGFHRAATLKYHDRRERGHSSMGLSGFGGGRFRGLAPRLLDE